MESTLQELLTKIKTDMKQSAQDDTIPAHSMKEIPNEEEARDDVHEETGMLMELNPNPPAAQLAEEIWMSNMDNHQYMENAKQQVISFFEGEHWHYREIITRSDVTAWELGITKDRVTVRMRVAIETDPRVCRIDAVMPVSVDPTYDAILCKELVRLNQPLRFGAFQYDESDGELSYRYSFPTKHGVFTRELKEVFLAVMLTSQENFLKLQKYAVGKFSKAETEKIQKYIDCLITDLELKT